LRPSNPTLHAASRSLFEERGVLVAEWAARLSDRAAGSHNVPPELMERHLRLMVDLVAEMAGPLRRESRELWEKACQHYGRTAAARGLVAGEVAEEFSALRELLTRDLAASVAALRSRQALAVLLHLNRVIDRGIAVAVAGYTDALVAELYVQDGVPSAGNGLEPADVERHLSALERELVAVTLPPTGAI
jgi:hypothetical protein